MAETSGPGSERRRTPRVDLLADLQGHAVTLDEQVQVTQLSLGGMTVETTAPLSPRVLHDFRISLAQSTLTVHGRVVHSRVVIRGDIVSYIAGVQFVDPTPAAQDGIRRIIGESQPSAG